MPNDAQRPGEKRARNRSKRVDAQRNGDAILQASMAVFDRLGVDAPMRSIAAEAGVGVGTLYRHFPQRSDLIRAIIEREVNECVAAAERLERSQPPGQALALWVQCLVDLAGTKRGLGPALHSGDPAYQSLPNYVLGQLTPALRSLLDAAAAAGDVARDVDARAVLLAAMRLAAPASAGDVAEARRMVGLLIDGLRFQAGSAGGTGER